MKFYGEIPTVPEGTAFQYRLDLSRAGVHRPTMGGISGNEQEPADSIVLSGGYEDDEDYGDVIVYTGEGGNDTTTKKQIANQSFTRGNFALANCVRLGGRIRVTRGFRNGSAYSPPIGYRYDGLYRVESYWYETGKSGFRICRFRLVKSAPTPTTVPMNKGQVAETKEEYLGEAPRQDLTVSRLIRSTETANAVKILHNYRCQICGERLETPMGPYAEAAHIRPLGRPHDGPDVQANILCLCPNHHVLFDMGAITIEDNLQIDGLPSSLRTVVGHSVSTDYLRYQREMFAGLVDPQ